MNEHYNAITCADYLGYFFFFKGFTSIEISFRNELVISEIFAYRLVHVPADGPAVPQRQRVNAHRAGQQQQQRGHRGLFVCLFIYLFEKSRAQLEE